MTHLNVLGRRHGRSSWVLAALPTCLLFCVAPYGLAAERSGPSSDQVKVENPSRIGVSSLDVQRVPVGITQDYKPCLARLPDGELLFVGFHTTGGVPNEYSFLYRSADGGRTWSKRHRLDLVGREPYLSVTRDGTVFISTHVLTSARGATEDYGYSYLYRSTDRGRTFEPITIGHDLIPGARPGGKWPGRPLIATGRNVLELADGTLVFAVGAPHGAEYLWRSRDGGQNWDRSLACTFGSIDMAEQTFPIFGEAFLHQAPNGDLLAVCRVILKFFPPIPGTTVPPQKTDQWERMILYRSSDGGKTWALGEIGSWYGEMYPSVLTLQSGDILFTFTVRAPVGPKLRHLGLRAVLGERTNDGFRFDFDRDRIILETRSAPKVSSGGGFGPTVQLDDGTLVSCYSYRTADNRLHPEVVRWRLP